MTQEEKQLLLNDLCARLPYHVKVAIEYSEGKYTRIYDLREIDNDDTSELRQQVTVWNYGFYSSVISYPLINCRPYLRPLSSMTVEEKKEFIDAVTWEANGKFYIDECEDITFYQEKYDWLNAHHFDYRGLIEKGLAISTEEFNPYKN